MGNPLTPAPPPGNEMGMVQGPLGPDVTLTQWHAQQQQRYNQVTGLANLLNWASTSGVLDKDAAAIAGGQYLRFLGEKDPFKALPKYTEWLQTTLEAHKAGTDAKQSQQAPGIVQPGPQPPPGAPPGAPQALAAPTQFSQSQPAQGTGPAALPATPNGQIGPTQLPISSQPGQTTVAAPQLQQQTTVAPSVPPPPGSNIPAGFGVGYQDVLARNQAMLQAQAQAPLLARMSTFDPEVKMLTDKGIPQDKAAMIVMSTRGYLPGGMFTAEAQAAKSGYIMDPMTGQMRPMSPDELSQQGQAQVQLQAARAQAQQANSELEKAKADYLTDPNNPKLKNEMQVKMLLAQYAGQRLQLAQQGMGIRTQEFAANFNPSILPLSTQNQMALPVDASGQAVGLKSPLAPGATQRGRQYQASVIQDAGNQLIAQVNANKGKFGNMQAIVNSAFLGTPLADAESQRLASQISSFAALQPALHGFRGQRALAEFTHMIGGLPNNPDALIAGIQGMMQTAGAVQNAVPGMRTTRGTPTPPPGSTQQNVIYARDPNGKLHRAPAGTKLPQGWKAENAPATQ